MQADAVTVTLITGSIVTIIGAIVNGTNKIIEAINANRAVTIAGQDASRARNKVQTTQIQEIHILSNSRLTAALRLIMIMSKKEADRTGTKEDIDTYNAALIELQKAEQANSILKNSTPDNEDTQAALVAENKLTELIKNTDGVKR